MKPKIKYYLITFLIALFVLLLCAEYFVRTTAPALNEKNDTVGWRLIKNLDLKFNVKDLLGNKYLVNFQTNENKEMQTIATAFVQIGLSKQKKMNLIGSLISEEQELKI